MPEKIRQQIARDCRTIFSDNVMVAGFSSVRWDDKKKKVLTKDGMVRILFVDTMGNPHRIVADVVIPRSVAHSLLKAIPDQLKKLENNLKNPRLPQKHEPTAAPDTSYLG